MVIDHFTCFQFFFIIKALCAVLNHSVMSDCLCNPVDHGPPGSSVHGDSPGKNTGVGCHALLQGIFPTQGSNPGLPHSGGFFTVWATRKDRKSFMYIHNYCFHVKFLNSVSRIKVEKYTKNVKAFNTIFGPNCPSKRLYWILFSPTMFNGIQSPALATAGFCLSLSCSPRTITWI